MTAEEDRHFHTAFELRDWAHLQTACDYLSLNGLQDPVGPGPARHRPQPVRLSPRAERADHRAVRRARQDERRSRLLRAAAVAPRPAAAAEGMDARSIGVEPVGPRAERRDAQVSSAPTERQRIAAEQSTLPHAREENMTNIGEAHAVGPGLSALLVALALSLWTTATVRAADPIKVGFSMALTGAVAPNGKQNLLALEIWRDDVNAKGGLLGPAGRTRLLRRPEQPGECARHLHQADQRRQSRPAARALCDQHDRAGDAGAHAEQQDDDQPAGASTSTGTSTTRRYFSMVPVGAEGALAFSRGFFELAAAQKPKPSTVAIVAADAEFGQDRLRRRARERQEARLQDRL